MSEAPRVLHIAPAVTSRCGGSAAFVVEGALALQEAGTPVTVFSTDMRGAPTARPFERARRADLPAAATEIDLELYPFRRPCRLAFSPAMYSALMARVADYDLVHIHMLWQFPQFAAFRSAARRGVPWLVSTHGNLDPFVRRRGRARKAVTNFLWQNQMLRGAAALHATTGAEIQHIADVAPAVPRFVVPAGVRTRAFHHLPSPRAFREEHLNGHDGPLVLFMGRIAYKKGLEVLLRAFRVVAAEDSRARLAIVGPDDEGLASGLVSLAASEGISARVTFTGPLYNEDRLKPLAAADVWVLPSHAENFGIAAVEALAAGLPVVVSPGVDISRELGEAEAAVVAERTPDAFAEAILGLLRDPARRRELSSRARAFAARYDWQRVGPQLAAMYSETLSDRGQRSPLAAGA